MHTAFSYIISWHSLSMTRTQCQDWILTFAEFTYTRRHPPPHSDCYFTYLVPSVRCVPSAYSCSDHSRLPRTMRCWLYPCSLTSIRRAGRCGLHCLTAAAVDILWWSYSWPPACARCCCLRPCQRAACVHADVDARVWHAVHPFAVSIISAQLCGQLHPTAQQRYPVEAAPAFPDQVNTRTIPRRLSVACGVQAGTFAGHAGRSCKT